MMMHEEEHVVKSEQVGGEKVELQRGAACVLFPQERFCTGYYRILRKYSTKATVS